MPRLVYRFATETTRRRFASIRRFLADSVFLLTSLDDLQGPGAIPPPMHRSEPRFRRSER